MDRSSIEIEIYSMMGLMGTDGTTINADTATRTYVQNKIQAAVDQLFYQDKWKFRRKRFGAVLKAPVTTGTISVTQALNTATLSSATPDSSWIGGHVYISANGFPLTVISYSGSVLTFAEYYVGSTNTAASYTMYFDSATWPSDCTGVLEQTMNLAGHGLLRYMSPHQMMIRQGYWLGIVGDYGSFSYMTKRTIGSPDVGEITHWTSWYCPNVSGTTTRMISVYPFPDQIYSLSWEGWRAPTAITVSGTTSGSTGIPDFPAEYHRMLLLPMVKLAMTEYPGFELSASEKQTLQLMVAEGIRKMNYENRDIQEETGKIRPSPYCL